MTPLTRLPVAPRLFAYVTVAALALTPSLTAQETTGESERQRRDHSSFYQYLRSRETGAPTTERSRRAPDEEDFGPPEVPRRPKQNHPISERPAPGSPTVVQPAPAAEAQPTPAQKATVQPPAEDPIELPPIHRNKIKPERLRIKVAPPTESKSVISRPAQKDSPIPDSKTREPRSRQKPRAQKMEPAEKEHADETIAAAVVDEETKPRPAIMERRNFSVKAPSYYRGIYINNGFFRSKHFGAFLKTAAQHGMNTLVIDIQPTMPSAEVLRQIHEAGFYTVARVVCFPDGLKTYPAAPGQVERILDRAELGAKAGFAEVQLDYIRFADNLNVKGLTLEKRYRYLSGILGRFEERLRPYRVRIGGDIFGRIAFNRHDIIGQKLEVFDAHLDTIYPMLYPSHFYGEPSRRRQPYRTVLEGTRDSRHRVKNSRIIPYVQAFTMRVGESGLSLEDYIRSQLDGARDSGGGGYVVWNARNDYQAFFRALGRGRFVKNATPDKETVAPGRKKKNQSL